MKILLCIRNDYYRNFAGDSMQLIKTAQYLTKMGLEVDINDGRIVDYSTYDIIHLFNLTRIGEAYNYYKIAKAYRKNIVLSSIYWDLERYYNYINDVESIKIWNKCKPYRFEILKGCKMIYPNSKVEGDIIKKEFGNNIPCTVTYNGVEIENKEISLYNFKERYQLNDYVLCVGRICHRKNQLALARACKDLGLQLVLIGNINDKEYFNQCLSYDNVKHLGFMDSYNIYNAYKFCKIHVLPSFIETPGLSSLEAAAAGCNIVSTSEGSTFEYFDNMAEYCNPYDDSSITEAIRKAYKKSPDNMLKKHIWESFNWEKCIKELYDSYKQIIE